MGKIFVVQYVIGGGRVVIGRSRRDRDMEMQIFSIRLAEVAAGDDAWREYPGRPVAAATVARSALRLKVIHT